MAIVFGYLSINKKFTNALKAKRVIRHIFTEEKKTLGDISIVFTDNNNILAINKTYLKHCYFTDVITFGNNLKDVVGGDVFISIDQVIANSKRYSTKRIEELFRVIIHGILHLVGYNDESEVEKKRMQRMEDSYLKKVWEFDVVNDDELVI